MNKLDEMKETYYSETQKKLNAIRKKLVEVEQDNSKLKEHFLEIYKIAHSIKSDSYGLGLSDVSEEVNIIEEKALSINRRPDLYDKYKTSKIFSEHLNNIKDIIFLSANSHLNDTIYINVKGIENIKDLFIATSKSHLNRLKDNLNEVDSSKGANFHKVLKEILIKSKKLEEEVNIIGLNNTKDIVKNLLNLTKELLNESASYNKNYYDELIGYINQIKIILDNIYLDENIKYEQNSELITQYISNLHSKLELIHTGLIQESNNIQDKEENLHIINKNINDLLSEANFLELTSIIVLLHEFKILIPQLKSENEIVKTKNIEKLFTLIHSIKNIVKDKFKKYDRTENIIIKQTEEKLDRTEDIIIKQTEEKLDNSNEIINMYAIETISHINNISEKLHELKSSKNNTSNLLKDIYREISTVVGDSNTVGFSRVSGIATSFQQTIHQYMKNPDEVDDGVISDFLLINTDLQELIKSKLLLSEETEFNSDKNQIDTLVTENKNEHIIENTILQTQENNKTSGIIISEENILTLKKVLEDLNTHISYCKTHGILDRRSSAFLNDIETNLSEVVKKIDKTN